METETIRVGVVGSGYIAGAHSAAHRTVAGTHPDVMCDIQLLAAADLDAERAASLTSSWGSPRSHTDWCETTRADEIDVVDICVPNMLHAEVACDALDHGTHVICEKPIANTWEVAREMAAPLLPLVTEELTAAGFPGHAAAPSHDLGWRTRLAASGAGALATSAPTSTLGDDA